MTWVINKMPPCGFGNRIIYYYNLRQKSVEDNCSFFTIPFSGIELFEGNMIGDFPPNERYRVFDFCLGEKFYDSNKVSTRSVFKLKNPPTVPENTCAIHFRGTDFHTWNPSSILTYEYYRNSIAEIRNDISSFALFTDDANLESYLLVQEYLKKEGFGFSKGINTSNRNLFAQDFAHMTECDYIISSPSTYAICAGFVGKQKKIIHSREWIESRVRERDKFWCDLYAGGNDNYKLWRAM